MAITPFVPSAEALALTGTAHRALLDEARRETSRVFGDRVFVRGVVEVSNHCRENCTYCGMRRDNRSLPRHRARWQDLASFLIEHRPAALTDLNIQAGEDPVAVREVALPLIRALRRDTPLGITVCLGTLRHEIYGELREAGASIYIMKFETADPARYRGCEAPGTLDERLAHIRHLAAEGWHVSSGFIAGLPGEDGGALMENLRLAGDLPLAGCSVSPFVPGEATPLSGAPAASAEAALNSMAVMRLMRPGWIIPAVSALNLADPQAGYRRGLQAGANLVTMNLTPAGLREDYLIYRRDRMIMTEERILTAIDAEGLRPSPVSLADHLGANVSGPGAPRPGPAMLAA